MGRKCLACYTDGIWYPATVTEVKDNIVSVHFDDYGEDMDVDMTQVVPSGELVKNMGASVIGMHVAYVKRMRIYH